MSSVCECGRYLGGRSVCECGRTVGSAMPPGLWDEPGRPFTPEPNPFAELPDERGLRDSVDSAPAIPASWGAVRGLVVEGEQRAVGDAGGVPLAWLALWAIMAITVLFKLDAFVAALTNAVLSLVFLFIGPIILIMIGLAVLSRIPGGGCLLALPSMLPLGRGHRFSEPPAGWDVLVETDSGAVPVRLAANAPLNGGEEVVVHGPALAGVKHAWLFQCLSPRPYTRVGRGVLRLLVGGLIIVPLFVALLVLYL